MQLLTLHGAARRVAARHFNEYDADIAAMYWVGLHVSAVLKLPSPLIRLAIVLERDPYKIGNSIGVYPALKARASFRCERLSGISGAVRSDDAKAVVLNRLISLRPYSNVRY